jgi:cell division protein FtsN
MKRKAKQSEKTRGQFGPAVLIAILAVFAVLILLLRMATFVAPHARH